MSGEEAKILTGPLGGEAGQGNSSTASVSITNARESPPAESRGSRDSHEERETGCAKVGQPGDHIKSRLIVGRATGPCGRILPIPIHERPLHDQIQVCCNEAAGEPAAASSSTAMAKLNDNLVNSQALRCGRGGWTHRCPDQEEIAFRKARDAAKERGRVERQRRTGGTLSSRRVFPNKAGWPEPWRCAKNARTTAEARSAQRSAGQQPRPVAKPQGCFATSKDNVSTASQRSFRGSRESSL